MHFLYRRKHDNRNLLDLLPLIDFFYQKKKSLLSEQFANLCTGLKTDYTIKNYTLIAFISRLHMAWQQ